MHTPATHTPASANLDVARLAYELRRKQQDEQVVLALLALLDDAECFAAGVVGMFPAGSLAARQALAMSAHLRDGARRARHNWVSPAEIRP